MELNVEEIAALLQRIEELGCAEVEIRVGDVYVAVRKTAAGATSSISTAATPTASSEPAAQHLVAEASPPSQADPRVDELRGWLDREAAGEVAIVRSPMVGVFYAAKAPGEPPFVEVGCHVSDSDVVGLVEVMKLFHSVGAGTTGVVRAILVEDAQPVEYLQPLVVVELEA